MYSSDTATGHANSVLFTVGVVDTLAKHQCSVSAYVNHTTVHYIRIIIADHKVCTVLVDIPVSNRTLSFLVYRSILFHKEHHHRDSTNIRYIAFSTKRWYWIFLRIVYHCFIELIRTIEFMYLDGARTRSHLYGVKSSTIHCSTNVIVSYTIGATNWFPV